MNIESRVKKLEDLIGIEEQDSPIIYIDIQDCSRDSDSQARPAIAIIPGVIGRPGIELIRDQGETETNFLDRAELEYSNFYG